METLAVQNEAMDILRRAFAMARRAVNGRLLAQRIAKGMCVGLLLSFPVLIFMLLEHSPAVAIITVLAIVNIFSILIFMVRGPWANTIDAAIYLEHQHQRDGLFITVSDCLAWPADSLCLTRHLHILMQASRICAGNKFKRVMAGEFIPVSPRLWAGNGLLIMGLLITAVVGRSFMALPSNPGKAIPNAGFLVDRVRRAISPGSNSFPRGLKKYNTANLPREIPASPSSHAPAVKLTAAQLRQRDAIRSLRKIQSQIGRLLQKPSTPSGGSDAGKGRKQSGAGASSAKVQFADLKAQFLTTADLPGINSKISMALVAAAHAIHASSRGDFAPRLRHVNRLIEAFLSLRAVPNAAIRKGVFTAAGGIGTDRSFATTSTAHSDGRLERAANLGRAIVMDIPSAVRSPAPAKVSWIRGSTQRAAVIPVRYRAIIERYFSTGQRSPGFVNPVNNR